VQWVVAAYTLTLAAFVLSRRIQRQHRRGVELRRAAERARLANEVSGRRRKLRDPAPVTSRGVRSRRVPPRDLTALEVEQASGGAR
jgi:hypothetical protein